MFSPDRAGGLRFVGAFAGVAGLIVLGFAILELQKDRYLVRRGVRAQGIVMGRDRDVDTSSSARLESYFLVVGYAGVRGRFKVSLAEYARLRTGSAVDVVYDPVQRSSARLASSLESGGGYKFPGLFALALLGVSVGFFIASSRPSTEALELDEALRRAKRGSD